jgi:hypothetical protein
MEYGDRRWIAAGGRKLTRAIPTVAHEGSDVSLGQEAKEKRSQLQDTSESDREDKTNRAGFPSSKHFMVLTERLSGACTPSACQK